MVPIRDSILALNGFLGLPWWAILIASSFLVRLSIFPLILVQMKRFSKLGPVSPALVFLKDAWKNSELGFWGKVGSSVKIYRDICRQENFRLSTVFVYNLAYYPLLISMIYGIRKLLASPELSGATFLHITVIMILGRISQTSTPTSFFPPSPSASITSTFRDSSHLKTSRL